MLKNIRDNLQQSEKIWYEPLKIKLVNKESLPSSKMFPNMLKKNYFLPKKLISAYLTKNAIHFIKKIGFTVEWTTS